MKSTSLISLMLAALVIWACDTTTEPLAVEVFETSAAGNSWKSISPNNASEATVQLVLKPDETYQTITGFGGAFTESTAYLVNQLGPENRQKVINAYFSDEGAAYSLTRTHINSCDFSLGNYAYVEDNDEDLSSFNIAEDMDDVVPMIKEAMTASSEGFKIFASPWTAPP